MILLLIILPACFVRLRSGFIWHHYPTQRSLKIVLLYITWRPGKYQVCLIRTKKTHSQIYNRSILELLQCYNSYFSCFMLAITLSWPVLADSNVVKLFKHSDETEGLHVWKTGWRKLNGCFNRWQFLTHTCTHTHSDTSDTCR